MRSTRYRDADGIAYLIFGVFLILCGARSYISTRLHPFPPPVGISDPVGFAPLFGSTGDWLLGLASAVLFIVFGRLKEIIEWVKRCVTYPRTGYVATTAGSRNLELGHVLMMVPVFVLIVGIPLTDTPASRRLGLWILAASFLVSFAGVLMCRRARAAEFLYIVFPASAFVLAWHFRRPDLMGSLLTMQGTAFVVIGLIHLFLYLRRNPRIGSGTSP